MDLFKDILIEELPKDRAKEDKEGTMTNNLFNSS